MPPTNFNEVTKLIMGYVTAEHARSFVVANRQFYQDVDWPIDILQAEFGSVRLSSIPGELIRTDSATQVRLRRSDLTRRNWSALPLPSVTRVHVECALASNYEYQVVVAPKRNSGFAEALRGIEILRREGFTVE